MWFKKTCSYVKLRRSEILCLSLINQIGLGASKGISKAYFWICMYDSRCYDFEYYILFFFLSSLALFPRSADLLP